MITRLIASLAAAVFGFISGVLRNARTFHPDGRTFVGTVRPATSDPTLLRAGEMLEGSVLVRVGMGIVKTNASTWARTKIPDAPSFAARFSPSSEAAGTGISLQERGEHELDILFTAGGDRLWKLIWNLITGGRGYGLNQFDYVRNHYFADAPYRIPACGLNVWLRLSPDTTERELGADEPGNPEARERAFQEALSRGIVLKVEAQVREVPNAPFLPFAEVHLDREIEIDQEALRFQPTAGRGFEPYGFLTALREKVYPASAHARPRNRGEREIRDRRGVFFRLFERPAGVETAAGVRSFGPLRLAKVTCTLLGALLVCALAYVAWRFLPNDPITNPPVAQGKYADKQGEEKDADEERFKYGSTGGEANLGFPFLIWQAAPLACAKTLKKVVGDHLAPDFVTRVRNYTPKPGGVPDETRKNLSREAYKAFGLIYEANKDGKENDIPVGVSMRHHMGVDRVFVNCAFCHSSTVRVSTDSKPKLVLGMPANLLNIRNFEDFLFQCTSGAEFSKENLIPEIENMSGRLSLLDRYIVYPVAIWLVRDRVQYLSSRLGFFVKQPEWGPGRVDTFSNAKGIFNWPWQRLPSWKEDRRVEPDQVGTADFPSIWRQGLRKKRADGHPMELHWDGNNDSVEERDLSAAFGTGALPPIIDHVTVGLIEDWLLKRSIPPKFTEFGFPAAVFDPQLAEKGKKIYSRLCANCHGASGEDFSGSLVGCVTRIEDIGTDPYRLDNYTEELSTTQAMLYSGQGKPRQMRDEGRSDTGGTAMPAERKKAKCHTVAAHGDAEENSYRFKRFHKTAGYANMPLDGLWLRAPYLHNGSVPTLRDLLKPQKDRPRVYFRGSDEYDPIAMGFVSDRARGPDGRAYFRYKTTEPGNSNAGHDGPKYGTDLSEQDKTALIEHLKTF